MFVGFDIGQAQILAVPAKLWVSTCCNEVTFLSFFLIKLYFPQLESLQQCAAQEDQDNQEDRTWYTREIAFLDSKAPKTGRQFKGIKNNLADFLGDFWTYFDASTRALEDVYLC